MTEHIREALREVGFDCRGSLILSGDDFERAMKQLGREHYVDYVLPGKSGKTAWVTIDGKVFEVLRMIERLFEFVDVREVANPVKLWEIRKPSMTLLEAEEEIADQAPAPTPPKPDPNPRGELEFALVVLMDRWASPSQQHAGTLNDLYKGLKERSERAALAWKAAEVALCSLPSNLADGGYATLFLRAARSALLLLEAEHEWRLIAEEVQRLRTTITGDELHGSDAQKEEADDDRHRDDGPKPLALDSPLKALDENAGRDR